MEPIVGSAGTHEKTIAFAHLYCVEAYGNHGRFHSDPPKTIESAHAEPAMGSNGTDVFCKRPLTKRRFGAAIGSTRTHQKPMAFIHFYCIEAPGTHSRFHRNRLKTLGFLAIILNRRPRNPQSVPMEPMCFARSP